MEAKSDEVVVEMETKEASVHFEKEEPEETEKPSEEKEKRKTLPSSQSSQLFRQKINLKFQNLCHYVQKKKKKEQILTNVSGCVNEGEMVAIMGPSGAGKTTLLDILAGRKSTGETTGAVLINDKPVTAAEAKLISYVVQKDILMPTETVYEVVKFHADMKLPRSITAEQKKRRIETAIESMGLSHRRDTKIGGVLPGGLAIRGLSGGEMRRVTIACSLVTSPSLLFLDEPTSGLDATNALMIMKKMVELTKKGVTIICTIHQPRAEIFRLFTNVFLLANGKVVYQGPEPVRYFTEKLGCSVPEFTADADFILDSMIDMVESKKEIPPFEQKIDFPSTENSQGPTKKLAQILARDDYMTPWWHQFGVMWGRTIRDVLRNPGTMIVRLGVGFVLSFLVATCFANLGNTQESVVKRAGLLYFDHVVLILLPFTSINLFLNKRELFNHERGSKLYRPWLYFTAVISIEIFVCFWVAVLFTTPSYWIAKLNPDWNRFFFHVLTVSLTHITADLLIVAVTNLTAQNELAFSLGSGLVVIFQIYTGFLVPAGNLPKGFSWIKWITFTFYSYRAAMVNEFKDVDIPCTTSVCAYQTGDDALALFTIYDVDKGVNAAIVFAWLAGYGILACVFLMLLHKERR